MLDFTYDPPSRNPGKPLLWIIIDSLIIALIAFLAALPVDRLPNIIDLYVSLKAFLISFFVQLVVERGVKPYSEKSKRKKRR